MDEGRIDQLQQRVETSRVGRFVMSAFALGVIAAVLLSTLPGDAELRKRLTPTTQPFLNALSLDQNWGVFAPDPRRETLEFRARVRYADGDTKMWSPPGGDPVIGASRYYRWRKFAEFVTADAYQQYWAATAKRIAQDETNDGKRPVQVSLLRRTRTGGAPGGQMRWEGPWQENLFFDYSPEPSER